MSLQTLPAIRFNNHRLRKTFLNEWLERLPLKVDLNKAVVHDRQRLLGTSTLVSVKRNPHADCIGISALCASSSRSPTVGLTFTVWEEARRTKAARRAAKYV